MGNVIVMPSHRPKVEEVETVFYITFLVGKVREGIYSCTVHRMIATSLEDAVKKSRVKSLEVKPGFAIQSGVWMTDQESGQINQEDLK